MTFDYPEQIEKEYAGRYSRRVAAAERAIRKAFEELRNAERATPAAWNALLRKARRAYNEAFTAAEHRAAGESTIRAIEAQRRNAFGVDSLQLNLERRSKLLFDQIDAMQALVNDYFDRLQNPETDENGLIAIAALGGLITKTTGIIDRRGKFYAKDQTGRIYDRVADEFDRIMGVDTWIWLRTTAANPRAEHLKRVGTEFNEDTYGDMPGELPGCQCSRRPTSSAIQI